MRTSAAPASSTRSASASRARAVLHRGRGRGQAISTRFVRGSSHVRRDIFFGNSCKQFKLGLPIDFEEVFKTWLQSFVCTLHLGKYPPSIDGRRLAGYIPGFYPGFYPVGRNLKVSPATLKWKGRTLRETRSRDVTSRAALHPPPRPRDYRRIHHELSTSIITTTSCTGYFCLF
jgi:hypothetical protein